MSNFQIKSFQIKSKDNEILKTVNDLFLIM